MSALNPQDWPKDQQVALLLCAVIGAVAGIVIGYALSGPRHYHFASWFTDAGRSLSWLWVLMGAFVGGAGFYLRRMR